MPSATESADTGGKRVGSFVSDGNESTARVFRSPCDRNFQWCARGREGDGAWATHSGPGGFLYRRRLSTADGDSAFGERMAACDLRGQPESPDEKNLARTPWATGDARAVGGSLPETQRADGSWLVRSRSPKFQPYFEGGFPYGHDRWISAMATGWSTAALALGLDQGPAKPAVH